MIKTWQERTPAGPYLAGIDRLQEVMQAEIDELRAELAKPKTQEPVGLFRTNDYGDLVQIHGGEMKNTLKLYLAAGAQKEPK